MSRPFVAIMMGSASDREVMEHAVAQLRQLEVAFEVRILSAHRTPEQTASFVREAQQRGCQVFIAAAGMAAHLAGAVAAHSHRPVIGVPLAASSLQGLDALLATVQMPGGMPVATMAIGNAGARNAAILAAQILALGDRALAERLQRQREEQQQKVMASDRDLQRQLDG